MILSPPSSSSRVREPVILSTAGAKDLLGLEPGQKRVRGGKGEWIRRSRAGSAATWLAEPERRQVIPSRVALFDQADLPGATPTFDLFFPGYCVTHVREPFRVDQASDVVSAREAWGQAALVLIDPSDQIVRDADVEHS